MEEKIPVYDFDPFNTPANVLMAVGLIIVTAAAAEDHLNNFIMGCLGTDIEHGAALTAHMPMPLKFSVAKSSIEIAIDDIDKIDRAWTLLDNLKAALDKRNPYAHALTGTRGGQAYHFSTQARLSLEVEIKPLSVDQIEREAVAIYDAGMALYTFMRQHGLIPKFPPNRAPRSQKNHTARKKRRKPAAD